MDFDNEYSLAVDDEAFDDPYQWAEDAEIEEYERQLEEEERTGKLGSRHRG
jgi:hypothetical protein